MTIKIGEYKFSDDTIKSIELSTALKIERLIEEKLDSVDCFVHLNGTAGKILVKIYIYSTNTIINALIYDMNLLAELGIEGFADMVILDVAFS